MNVCDFGGVLRELRKNRGLTQEELGIKVGLSKAVVSKYENGLGFPNFDMLIKLAEFFGVTSDYLLGVPKAKTLDVSRLTETQINLIRLMIAEFNRLNAE